MILGALVDSYAVATLDPYLILALQNVEGGLGSMIAVHHTCSFMFQGASFCIRHGWVGYAGYCHDLRSSSAPIPVSSMNSPP